MGENCDPAFVDEIRLLGIVAIYILGGYKDKREAGHSMVTGRKGAMKYGGPPIIKLGG